MTSVLKTICEREIDRPQARAAFTRFQHWVSRLRSDFQTAGLAARDPEALARHCDGRQVSERQVRDLANWQRAGVRDSEIRSRSAASSSIAPPAFRCWETSRPYAVRCGDLATRRAVSAPGPVDMVLDHTLTVDFHGARRRRAQHGTGDQPQRRTFRFRQMGDAGYQGIRLFHRQWHHQVNLEYLAPGLLFKDGVCFPTRWSNGPTPA
jgi:aconitate hydratase